MVATVAAAAVAEGGLRKARREELWRPEAAADVATICRAAPRADVEELRLLIPAPDGPEGALGRLDKCLPTAHSHQATRPANVFCTVDR
jgi:hypothetical protein